MNLTSKELKVIQEVLDEKMKELIESPCNNYQNLKKYIDITDKVDIHRREIWHNEKFGVYEEIVDEVSDSHFTADDIPF